MQYAGLEMAKQLRALTAVTEFGSQQSGGSQLPITPTSGESNLICIVAAYIFAYIHAHTHVHINMK